MFKTTCSNSTASSPSDEDEVQPVEGLIEGDGTLKVVLIAPLIVEIPQDVLIAG
jgi:hypothetical protein